MKRIKSLIEKRRQTPRVKSSWVISAVAVAAFFGTAYVATAATYNFYFNNTEQGDNSTASPNVTVHSDGKVEKSGGTETTQPKILTDEPKPAPAVAESRAEVKPSAASEFWNDLPFGQTEQRHLRLTAGIGSLVGDGAGPIFNAAIVFNEWVAINGWATSNSNVDWLNNHQYFGGAELELTPLHIPLGAAHPRFIEIGLLAGASNLFIRDDNWVSPHVGGRVTFNFGNTIALTGVVRGNAGYQMIDAGLAIKL